ncbi:multiubiquitin domain-containing protein [Algoriphagus sp. Y33]|uniref:multiubiquitin domain-containing protein n=1 Tax=Algoriphagus sp. Y33 TaxID=2772483 RepID=UPI0017841FCE|nr:multiubiquitin domain-containing protein [Algoriphagus sp. Y33]
MEPLKEGGQSPTKPSLKLVIEGKQYETFEQYLTGAQLKELAGIPWETDLFLSITRPYNDELIENDKSVNLARPETEYFFVKKKLHFSIDGKPFVWYKQFIRGIQIRELGNIPPEIDIFLDIKEGWEDDLITDDEVVDLARPGKEKFITKPAPVKFAVIVNALAKDWNKPTISFEQVVELAFGAYDPNPNKGYTVTYFRGHEPKPEGTMVKNSVVRVKNKMLFNVTATDKS